MFLKIWPVFKVTEVTLTQVTKVTLTLFKVAEEHEKRKK